MINAWQQTIDTLKKIIPESDFTTWINPIHYSHKDGSTVILSVPNSFSKEWLEDNYLQILTKILTATLEYDVTISFIIRADEEHLPYASNDYIEDDKYEPNVSNATLLSPELVFTRLDPRYTFDLFVSGAGNQFAHAAAMAVASNPANTYNPLFIYGSVGLGKSHLLNAIGHYIRQNSPELKIRCCTSEKFMTEMINHIRSKTMEEFRTRFRNLDVLLIDDIQFISKKVGTQEELFHTFNALYSGHKQLVFTSDKFPKEIPDLEDRLRSRFEWGLIADIQPPDIETKIAIMKKKSEVAKVVIPDDVYYFLASSDTKSIRELEGMLIRLGAISSLQSIPVTLEMAKKNLKNVLAIRQKEITSELIQKTVAEFFNVKVADLKSDKRTKNLVQSRQVAMWLCRDMTKLSYPDIGKDFGGKDHSTVIHSCKKVDSALASDPKLSDIISELKNNLQK